MGSSSVIGGGAGASNNYVIVSDGGLWVNSINPAGAVLRVGESGSSNRLFITSGGTGIVNTLTIGVNASAANNLLTVQGAGSVLQVTNGNLVVGSSGAFNRMEILDGAVVTNSAIVTVGGASTGTNNTVLVTGAGSRLSVGSTLALNVSANNLVLISNGAVVSANAVTVTGSGGNNRVIVTDGGILEGRGGNWSVSGTGNIVSNNGGVYQFTTVPAPGGISGGGVISLLDGTLAFRGMTNADVFSSVSGVLANIAYAGTNRFRLNASSNTATVAQNYTFDTGLGATNFVGLEMIQGSTLWRSQRLTIGANGTLLASNTIGTVAAVVTNTGLIEVKHSTMTWASNVVIQGRYVSDPSTNIFLADVTVSPSGTLAGGMGDRFEFSKNLFIQSTNHTGFNLASSTVAFTGGGLHTNSITGADLGSNAFAYAVAYEKQTNFAYGELRLGSASDEICFQCGTIPLAPSNALYVGWLDLLDDTNLVANLHAPTTINLYYDATDPRNAYLGALTYSLTDCDEITAGGLLMPLIPEPNAVLLCAVGTVALFLRKRASHP